MSPPVPGTEPPVPAPRRRYASTDNVLDSPTQFTTEPPSIESHEWFRVTFKLPVQCIACEIYTYTVHVYTYTQSSDLYVYVYIYVYIDVMYVNTFSRCMYIYVHVYAYTYMYIHTPLPSINYITVVHYACLHNITYPHILFMNALRQNY